MTEHERPLDVDRIAFVTRRFHELQGLSGVVCGSALVLGAVLACAVDLREQSPSQFAMLAMAIGQTFRLPFDFWYRRTFGEIVVTPTAEFVAGLPMLGMLFGV